jgi:ABC-type lipoprotein release transport system permease subunit
VIVWAHEGGRQLGCSTNREIVSFFVIAFLWRNLRWHARSHLGAFLGVFVATAVLVGALAIGDCVRGSLQELALLRLGQTHFAIAPGDRFFRAQLAADLTSNAAPVLQLPCMATAPDGSSRANQVQILGVDDRFWDLSPMVPSSLAFRSNSVILNKALATQLHARVGDSILLRVQKPSLLSGEAPLSPRDDVAAAFRLTVSAVASPSQFGNFGLLANAAPPFNAFIPLSLLQAKAELTNKANLLLIGAVAPGFDLTNALRQRWKLADASLELRTVPDALELRSDRVFLDPAEVVAAAPLAAHASILTYFVNELRDTASSNATPYSMVAAAGPPWSPADLRDDEINITQWLADDLDAKSGDDLALKYYVLGSSHRLEQEERHFRIHTVLPMDSPWADRTLMPDIPGIAKAEKTQNWDAGFRIELQKIRPKDEQYWKQYRGTPKAFVTLRAGEQMWSNRFGSLTALRFAATNQNLDRDLLSALDPAAAGLAIRPVRALALAASSQAEDLGQYFVAFSFFIVAAALILLAMLFQFGLEKRATEIGILLALGWKPRRVRRLLLGEGIALAGLGGVAGVFGGLLYARGILFGLSTLWGAAVNHTELSFHVTPETLVTGAASGILVSVMVIWFALRAQSKRPARDLLERGHELERPSARTPWSGWMALVCGVSGAAWLASAVWQRRHADAEAFFGSATLLLVAGLAGLAMLFRRAAAATPSPRFSGAALAWRALTRRPKRSLATVALLGSGAFLIVAVAANKLDANQDSALRSSGTGGFAFIGESALPIVQDLNSPEGREFFGLDDPVLAHVAVVPFRVKDGDDASCLNLNRAQNPRLLGVDPQALASRGAFTFTEQPAGGWLALTNGGDEIPAIGDDASLKYALHKSIGDTIDYVDETGRHFKLKLVGALANSVLQGNLVISENAFVRRYPSDGGARLFLVDAPVNQSRAVSAALTRGLQDRGLQLTPAATRLNAYNAVQNAYLDTFQALGGLGLLLGTIGLAVVVMRNVLDRRFELAAMAAMGFRRRALSHLVLLEHAALECLGLLLGSAAALLAVLPVLLQPRAQLSLRPVLLMLAVVFISGILWAWLATRLALRGPLLEALRDE